MENRFMARTNVVDAARVVRQVREVLGSVATIRRLEADGQDAGPQRYRLTIHVQCLSVLMGDGRESLVAASGRSTTTDYLRQLWDALGRHDPTDCLHGFGDLETWLSLIERTESGTVTPEEAKEQPSLEHLPRRWRDIYAVAMDLSDGFTQKDILNEATKRSTPFSDSDVKEAMPRLVKMGCFKQRSGPRNLAIYSRSSSPD
jgi:hypothetical protein